jgi:plasmid stabilization system protein ParE
MSYTVVLKDNALADKRSIRAYLKQFYPGTPGKFLSSLKKQLRALADMPYMYPVWEDNPVYRKMLVQKNYLVFYKVKDEEKTIEIHRILPGSWDLARHFP